MANPVAERARSLVKAAIGAGTLQRPDACEHCGAAPPRPDRHPLDAHHISYARPLDVLWLCAGCHALAHPRPPKPGSARFRAEAELRADPRRSDALIARAVLCTPQAAGRWRRELEESGVIEHIAPADRAARVRTWPARTPARLAIEAGAATPEQVMQLASVSYGTAWRALSRTGPRVVSHAADAAAATDSITVLKLPRLPKRITTGERPQPGYYREPHAIEWWCCTAIYRENRWQHDRACPVRVTAASR